MNDDDIAYSFLDESNSHLNQVILKTFALWPDRWSIVPPYALRILFDLLESLKIKFTTFLLTVTIAKKKQNKYAA